MDSDKLFYAKTEDGRELLVAEARDYCKVVRELEELNSKLNNENVVILGNMSATCTAVGGLK